MLKEKSKKADVSWQTVIKGLDFYEEMQKIESYLDEEVGPERKSMRKTITDDVRGEVREASFAQECQFDLETVKEYVKS